MFTACKLIKIDSYIQHHQYKPCWVGRVSLISFTLKWTELFCCTYLLVLGEKINTCISQAILAPQASSGLLVGRSIVLGGRKTRFELFGFNWPPNLFEISWVSRQWLLPRRWSFLTLTSWKNAVSSSQLELKNDNYKTLPCPKRQLVLC